MLPVKSLNCSSIVSFPSVKIITDDHRSSLNSSECPTTWKRTLPGISSTPLTWPHHITIFLKNACVRFEVWLHSSLKGLWHHRFLKHISSERPDTNAMKPDFTLWYCSAVYVSSTKLLLQTVPPLTLLTSFVRYVQQQNISLLQMRGKKNGLHKIKLIRRYFGILLTVSSICWSRNVNHFTAATIPKCHFNQFPYTLSWLRHLKMSPSTFFFFFTVVWHSSESDWSRRYTIRSRLQPYLLKISVLLHFHLKHITRLVNINV